MKLTAYEKVMIDDYIRRNLGLFHSKIGMLVNPGFLQRPDVQRYVAKREKEILRLYEQYSCDKT